MFKTSLTSLHLRPQCKTRLQHVAFLSNIPSFASTRKHVSNNPIPQQQKVPQTSNLKASPRRIFKYSLAAAALLAASIASAYEITHLYTEHFAMSPESDDEIKQFGWDFASYWSGDISRAGTDPQLSNRTRHLIHAAWGASEWDFTANANLQSNSTPGQPALKIVDTRLLTTEKYLRAAINSIEAEDTTALHPETLPQLQLQHALVLEQMEPHYWIEAKEALFKAWKDFPDPSYRAFIAWKLGDINERLGLDTEAQDWWNKATNIVQGRIPTDSPSNISAPSSPLLQRILFSTLVSQSAFLARHKRLKEARKLEESALDLLRSIRQPESFSSSAPPEALHALYLLQRSSLFSIHLAEVLYAQKYKWGIAAQYIQTAAESSGRVACMLTDGQPIQTNQNPMEISLTNETLLPIYDSSRSMNKPAHVLLREARRTASEAWNLLGILYEKHEGAKSQKALECFRQAVSWAGTTGPHGTQQAAESTLESDWRIYKRNFERLNSQISSKKS